MKKSLFGMVSSLSIITALAVSGAGAVATSAAAQDAAAAAPVDDTVVVVTGIRRSLRASATIKRQASGVVDAITSEDIGKFPDTNLAESIQRIPGVSIDRSNNEGSRVTVRGFGPDYNLVTLNGRSMPGANLGGASAPATRSFDFANLSADSISGVDIYKTGRADVASGGIGSVIDIRTAKPFDFKGMRAGFQVKGVMDTSNEVGQDVTPELSGLFSNTFADGRVGILINGSYSERDSREQNAQTDGWIQDVGMNGAQNVTNNNQNPGGHTWAPQNLKFDISDHHRERSNGQVVLQFRPIESLTATVDYTYSLYKDQIDRNQFGVWFNFGGAISKAVIDENGTFTTLNELGGDYSQFGYADNFRNENKSTGLNLKWDATDNLTFTFDGHHSTAESGGTGAGNNSFIIMGQGVDAKTYTMTDNLIPTVTIDFLGNQTDIKPENIDSLLSIANKSYFSTTIDQYRADGQWRNGSDSGLRSIRFGVENKKMATRSMFASNFISDGFYGGNQGQFDDNLFTRMETSDLFSEISGGGSNLIPFYYSFDPQTVQARAAQVFGYTFEATNLLNDNYITEEVNAAYVSFDFQTEFNGMPFKALGGVRYEHTDVTARSLQKDPTAIQWDNPTEFHTIYAATADYTNIKADYDEFLPSLDTSLEIRSNLITRFSYSKTITRSDLTAMVGSFSVSPTPKVNQRQASQGNPGLLPYESDNIDLSAEWYYARDSYVSVNYFSKHVENFLTTTVIKGPVNGLTDPFLGAAAETARAQLTAEGIAPSQENVYNRMVSNAGGQTEFRGQPGDPLAVWDITSSTNANDVTVYGWEFAVQHVFGDSGFGLQANISLPAGGAKYDPAVVGNQFALPGLSKSYNLVGFYEKNGFQARVAYNWRDTFLLALGQLGAANQPQNVKAYGQLDASASYDFSSNLSVFVDGINITNSTQYVYGRYENQIVNARQYGPRYQVGVRYKF